jgi:hypothetical protein
MMSMSFGQVVENEVVVPLATRVKQGRCLVFVDNVQEDLIPSQLNLDVSRTAAS